MHNDTLLLAKQALSLRITHILNDICGVKSPGSLKIFVLGIWGLRKYWPDSTNFEVLSSTIGPGVNLFG